MSVSRDKATGYWSYNFMYKGVRYHRRFKSASYDEVVGYEAIARAELRKSGYDITEAKTYMLSEIIQDFKDYADNNYTRPKEAKLIIDNFYKLSCFYEFHTHQLDPFYAKPRCLEGHRNNHWLYLHLNIRLLNQK